MDFVYSRPGRSLCGNFRMRKMHWGGSRGFVLLRDLFEPDIRSESLINRVLRFVYDSLVNCHCADHAAHAVLRYCRIAIGPERRVKPTAKGATVERCM